LCVVDIFDEASRFSAVQFVENKTGALSAPVSFVRFLMTASYPFGQSCLVHSDQDSVFEAADFVAFLRGSWCCQRFADSARRTVMPRKASSATVCTVTDSARAVLITAQCQEIWCLAIQRAKNMRNVLPTAALDTTPYVAFWKRRPDLSQLYTFSMRAFVHHDIAHGKKFQPKAKQAVYVGYSFVSMTLLVWLPSTTS
jgi:hypothetical protein